MLCICSWAAVLAAVLAMLLGSALLKKAGDWLVVVVSWLAVLLLEVVNGYRELEPKYQKDY